MTRRSLFALVLVLAAYPALAPAGERIDPGRSFEEVGTVTARTRDSGLFRGTAYTLHVPGGFSISLLLTGQEQAATLDRLVAARSRAHVRGVWYEVNHRQFLVLESIDEPPGAGRPYKATGVVTVEARNFGDGVGRAYFLRTPADVKLPLFFTDGRQAEVLDRLAADKLPARVEGTRYEVNRRSYVIVESIKEPP
jgi:hypothetical protein